ncbi:MAG: membrane protein insertase YidC [Lautropia sp.]
MQTQRTILWVIFVMSLLFLWDAWQKHNGQPTLFGGASTQKQAAPAPGTAAPDAAPGVPGATVPTAPPVPASGSAPQAGTVPGAAAPAAQAQPGKVVRLANDVLQIDVDTTGGTLRHVELLKHKDDTDKKANLTLLETVPGRFYQAQTGVIGIESAPNHTTPWSVVSGPTAATAGEPARLVLAATGGGVRVEKTYTLAQGSYQLEVRNTVTNEGQAAVTPTVYMQLTRDGQNPPGTSGMYSTYTGPVFYTDAEKFQKVDFPSIEKGKASFAKNADNGWVGIIQHYFAVAWVPRQGLAREYYTRRVDNNLYSVGAMQTLPAVAPGQSQSLDAKLFIGPQDQRILSEVAPGLDLVVDYGWLTAIAKPLFWLLNFLHGIVRNWGWAIVLLTIIVKLAFFPLQAASYRSMAKMRKVTPKMTALRERYGDDKMKLNQAMMELYKTEKINPLGGCLPVVVQIPVFIALYWVLLASVEMRNAPWMLWIKDLSAPDPFFILPLVMAATMFAQTKLNPKPPDPMQAKLMMWMPLIFSVMFFFFPAGLVLYWVVSNLFSIAQQWVITRRIEGKPVFGRAPA